MQTPQSKLFDSTEAKIQSPAGGWVALANLRELLFLLSLALMSGCSTDNVRTGPAAPPLTVKAIQLAPHPLQETINVTGSLISSVAVDVNTEFAGHVVKMNKQEGDSVRQGELLAELDDANAQLSMAQANASLEVSQAALNRAKVTEEHAQAEQERAQNLLRSGGITEKDFLAAEVATRDAQAQVKLAEAQIEQSRQTLAIAQKRSNDCRILSPIRGTVERKGLNPGSYVDANTVLYRLVDNHRLELETFVAAPDISRLAKGQTIRFSVASFAEGAFTARIVTISSGVQLQNRSLVVRAAFSNPTGRLKAGMFFKGQIVVGTKANALLVPASAVWRRAGQPAFVYVVEQGQARRRQVKIGIEQPENIEVVGGLKASEWVIAEQYLELADGIPVAMTKAGNFKESVAGDMESGG
ncbi:MAG: efflux RND transporter periplasmic adaptor subunit [Acidobacteria bacterium]|nr:efflux RND transporter periplasmic adaptor subunit [Acidobacteriota bacterium]